MMLDARERDAFERMCSRRDVIEVTGLHHLVEERESRLTIIAG